MAQLKIFLLGPIRVALDERTITGFKSNKVRSLLAYLAVEADKPHRRESLAGLLWPDWPEREALSNLRFALSDLRRAIDDHAADPHFLIISRDSVQINGASDYWLDVTAFAGSVRTEKSDPSLVDRLEAAVDLYRGSFLEGFSLEDSPAFEQWTSLNREHLTRQVSRALHSLSEIYEQRGMYDKAQSHAWRQLELEPWEESAHQRLMRVLALSGQRSAALAQYEICRTLLAKELDVEPSEETTRLYEAIRDGRLRVPASPPTIQLDRQPDPPSFLDSESPRVERTIVVAREAELAALNDSLEQALAGRGGVVFVTGDAGSGKTALIQEFVQRSQDARKELVVASGNCNAYTGIGDPYLPFREILELLTGDVQSRWAAGTITRDHALRLWRSLPVAVHALVATGTDLVDTFVQRGALLERAIASTSGQPDWLRNLEEFLERKPPTAPSVAASHQVDLFAQYTRVLQMLEQQTPLLLVIDDLQWADTGSISLLFHLGRRLKGARVLLLGAYRPEEVTLGRDGGRHPLEPVVNEFRREFGDVVLNAGQIEGRKFIETFLNSETNRLGPSFREMLFHQTQGHPLFTIELLRGLQERGDMTRDSEGYWIEGPSLDWVTLPVRVEAAIQERIGRLPELLQAALAVASIEGEFFTAEVLARVRAVDKQKMLEYLSTELDRRHRLVQAQSIQRVDGNPLSRYRFRHILFQKYLYGSLDEVERVHLHEQVGTALEELYGDQVESAASAVQMARHFEEAKITEKVTHYLHNAGIRALQLSAYQDGVAHLTRGLVLLGNQPVSSERARRELDLLLALGLAWQAAKGGQSVEAKEAFTRARELCQEVGNTSQMVQVLGGLVVWHYVQGELHQARELADEALDLAQNAGEPLLILLCHWFLGFVGFCLGEHRVALEHLRYVLDTYEPREHHHSLVSLRGSDAGLGAMAYEACCLWCLGYPEQANKRSEQALALAQELGHPFSSADVLFHAGCLFHSMRRDADGLETTAEALMRLSQERGLAGWYGNGLRSHGEALALQGRVDEGVAQAREGIRAMMSESIWVYSSATLGSLADAQARAGRLEDGLATVDEAFALVNKTDERFWEPELYRVQGVLLVGQGEDVKAERSFQEAIEIARRQSARSLELRAVTDLCGLWMKQGKKTEAHDLLSGIYNWFTERIDTPDLVEARELLQRLDGELSPIQKRATK